MATTKRTAAAARGRKSPLEPLKLTALACKVFSATLHKDRNELGDRVSAWIREVQFPEVVSTKVVQSSDQQYHCLSIVVWYRREL